MIFIEESSGIILVDTEAGHEKGVNGDLNDHDKNSNDPKWNQNALQKGRRIAHDEWCCHLCW